MDYIDRLTELRIDRDVKQTKIAELLGCKQSAVSKYETRKVPYHTEDIAKLCRFYNVSADYVLGLPEGMPYPKRTWVNCQRRREQARGCSLLLEKKAGKKKEKKKGE